MNNFLIWDVETNGLPKGRNGAVTDTSNWPRITQLAWAVYSEEGGLIKEKCELIKPDNWVIPREKFFQDNGYTTERSTELGVPMRELLSEFAADVSDCDVMIAHNLAFDYPTTVCEMLRYGVSCTKKPEKFCTMKAATNICCIPGKFGGFKWPNLTELHTYCFGVGFDGAHDALSDVRAAANCFFHLLAQGEITLPNYEFQ